MQHDASYPREEPGAGNLHARIREGESRMAELLDHPLRYVIAFKRARKGLSRQSDALLILPALSAAPAWHHFAVTACGILIAFGSEILIATHRKARRSAASGIHLRLRTMNSPK